MKSRISAAFVLPFLCLAVFGRAPAVSAAAIQSSVCDGSKVNANLYDDPREVYLSGGPQFPACGNVAGFADGTYYFQVTDPSGKTLLSSDPLNCRVVTVSGGVITGYTPDASCPAGSNDPCGPVPSNGPHNAGTGVCSADFPSQISVQMWPFTQTPNHGGVYKMWLEPTASLPAACDPTQVDPSLNNANCPGHGFVSGAGTKTDNFRIKSFTPPPPPPHESGAINANKFCDANGDGLLEPDELLLQLANWQINFSPDPNNCSGLTDINGMVACANLDPGTYNVSEVEQSNFNHTGTCTDGVCGTCAISQASCATNLDCPGLGDSCVPNPVNPAAITVVGTGDIHEVDFLNIGVSSISGRKFQDVNLNGVDNSDPGLAGVKVLLTGTTAQGQPVSRCTVTDGTGAYSFGNLLPGTYSVSEVKPANTVATTPTSCNNISFALDAACAGGTSTCSFGDVCLGGTGGHTLGFWSNKNGQKLETAADLSFLAGLNLRNANGSNFDPTTKTQLHNWLLSANAVNMAYMLSAQLTAMELNVRHSFLSVGDKVFAGSAPNGCTIPGLSNLGFISIGDLMSDANADLGTHAVTLSGNPDRACQEFMKDALDAGNNNQNIVVACPANFGATCP